MRRKDGQKKLRAIRSMPEFAAGFRRNVGTAHYRHPSCDGASHGRGHRVVSLFAGCGGMDLGILGGFEFLGKLFPALPFEIVEALDNSEDCIETYKLNIGDHARLADLTSIDLAALPGSDVLIGGFPCQDFSSSGPKVGLSGKRGQLYKVLVEYMEHHRPPLVVGENVPHLARLNEGRYLDRILRDFEAVGYRFDVWELYAPDYGVPQSRRRLILVGVRDDIEGAPEKPAPTHSSRHVTVDEALRDLEGVHDERVTNQSQYYVATRATSGGGQGDHTNKVGEVAYCIRANPRGRVQFHYSLERRLTVRECARLQSFPDEFVFPFSTQRNLSLIGNAVPPVLAHSVALSIAAFLAELQTSNKRSKPRRGRRQQLDLPDLKP
jgi:DNA (cytosine-5)-methyltransferase 1